MTFESRSLWPKSEKELLEEEKASLLKQLENLDAIDQDFLEGEDVRLESEILLIKEKLADYGLAGGDTKAEYDPTEFSPIEQSVIENLRAEKKQLIEDRKQVRLFLKQNKDEMRSEFLDQLTDVISKLKNL